MAGLFFKVTLVTVGKLKESHVNTAVAVIQEEKALVMLVEGGFIYVSQFTSLSIANVNSRKENFVLIT